jgi:hypothetical protein
MKVLKITMRADKCFLDDLLRSAWMEEHAGSDKNPVHRVVQVGGRGRKNSFSFDLRETAWNPD